MNQFLNRTTYLFIYLFIYFISCWNEVELQQYGTVLEIGYMSEDEDNEDRNGWCHLKLEWQADEIMDISWNIKESTQR